MDYRTSTLAVYDAHADVFEDKFGRHFDMFKDELTQPFFSRLPGKRLLDLGAGPGHHAAFFKENGLEVLCVDASQAMVHACQAKGLDARQGLIENIAQDFASERFDGVWAYASLLHLPKVFVPQAIADIVSLLAPGGVLGITLKEGEGEGFEHGDKNKYDGERYFSYFTEQELRDILALSFDVVVLSKTNVAGKYVFMNVVAIRR